MTASHLLNPDGLHSISVATKLKQSLNLVCLVLDRVLLNGKKVMKIIVLPKSVLSKISINPVKLVPARRQRRSGGVRNGMAGNK